MTLVSRQVSGLALRVSVGLPSSEASFVATVVFLSIITSIANIC